MSAPLILTSLATVVVLMSLLWVYATHTSNAGIVDIGWTISIIVMALFSLAGAANFRRSLCLTLLICAWGGRLTWHLYKRVVGKAEDPRYVELRRKWGRRANIYFLYFFLAQGVLAVLLSLPQILASRNRTTRLSVVEYAGIVIGLVAVAGEALADAQLTAFKSRAENRGKTCRDGLWQYSRHPNYFFEWLVWIALAVFSLASPYGYLALICPALMLFFLLKMTGIPATEIQALKTKGEDYRRYQRTTSAFVPWFPRQDIS
jgi:steroid 5-alpha reductase family enzyme